MSDSFNLIGVIPYRRKQLEKENGVRNWEKFTGLQSKFNSQSDSLQTEEEKPATFLQREFQNTPVKLRSGKEILAS
jgi:hypothetical protein